MAILLDFSPVAMACLYSQMKYISEDGQIQEDIVRHMIFDSIRATNRKHSRKYGEMIICFDTTTNWRKEEFKPYKACRKKNQDKNKDMDWAKFYGTINETKEAIKANLPYLSLEIPRAEADDILGTLARYLYQTKPNEPNLVVSTDGDMNQLLRYPNTDRYTPMGDKFVTSSDPLKELKEKIFRGDSGDGVPNMKSKDDVFLVEGARQTPMTKKFIDSIIDLPEDELQVNMSTPEYEGYLRNQMLIDLAYTPQDVSREIIRAYEKREIKGSMMGLMSYFSKNRMKLLTAKVDEFKCLQTKRF